jgi:DnaJ-class molecular chaperone
MNAPYNLKDCYECKGDGIVSRYDFSTGEDLIEKCIVCEGVGEIQPNLFCDYIKDKQDSIREDNKD